MKYPLDFISLVKQTYPTVAGLHHSLDSGDPDVGKYLESLTPSGIRPDQALSATSLDQIKTLANDIKAKQNVYAKWILINHAQNAIALKKSRT